MKQLPSLIVFFVACTISIAGQRVNDGVRLNGVGNAPSVFANPMVLSATQRINFGPSSASNPAIRISALVPGIDIVTTDDSAFASISAAQVNPNAGINIGATGYMGWNTKSYFYSLTNGTLKLANFADTAGVSLDFATDNIVKVRNRAGTLDAAITASTLQSIGVAFASLPASASGTILYCSDCAPVTSATCPATKASCVCTNGGVGSLAVRTNSLWYCPF
jgi:hypothetical protein